jgi:hypothetical protein
LWLLPCADAFSLATLSGFACEVLQFPGFDSGLVSACDFSGLPCRSYDCRLHKLYLDSRFTCL